MFEFLKIYLALAITVYAVQIFSVVFFNKEIQSPFTEVCKIPILAIYLISIFVWMVVGTLATGLIAFSSCMLDVCEIGNNLHKLNGKINFGKEDANAENTDDTN